MSSPIGRRGRLKGARNKSTLLLERMLADDGAAVVGMIVAKAKAGDLQAAKMILDRIVPPRRERAVQLDLPPVATAADALRALNAVAQAVAAGDLTPGEGQTLAGLVDVQRRAIETADLEARLAKLEAVVTERER